MAVTERFELDFRIENSISGYMVLEGRPSREVSRMQLEPKHGQRKARDWVSVLAAELHQESRFIANKWRESANSFRSSMCLLISLHISLLKE